MVTSAYPNGMAQPCVLAVYTDEAQDESSVLFKHTRWQVRGAAACLLVFCFSCSGGRTSFFFFFFRINVSRHTSYELRWRSLRQRGAGKNKQEPFRPGRGGGRRLFECGRFCEERRRVEGEGGAGGGGARILALVYALSGWTVDNVSPARGSIFNIPTGGIASRGKGEEGGHSFVFVGLGC